MSTQDESAIERVKVVLPAVTPGPWMRMVNKSEPHACKVVNGHGYVFVTGQDEDDAEFIALSRTVVPALIADGARKDEEIARKDALIAELAESLSHSEEENGIGYIEDKHPPFRCNHCLKRSDWLDAMEHTAACIITRAKSEIGQ